MEKIMKNMNAILRLVNCTRKVDMDAFEAMCKQTYELMLIHFPFMMIVSTIHELLGHCAKLMREMGNCGLVSFIVYY